MKVNIFSFFKIIVYIVNSSAGFNKTFLVEATGEMSRAVTAVVQTTKIH